jgi:hypothetical protein
MDKFFFYKRIFQNILINIFKFKFSFLKLFPNYYIKPNLEKIETKRLFIVSSCLNPNNLINQDRITQTIEGLQSIKKNYPDSFIVFLENSILTNSQELQIIANLDLYINYFDDTKIQNSNLHYNKGVPQFLMFLKFLIQNFPLINFEFIHFMSARYKITEKINDNFIQNGVNFKFNLQTKNVSTRHFIFKNSKVKIVIKIVKYSYFFALLGCSVEDTIFLFTKKYNKLLKLFVSGYVSGIQFISE